MRDNPFPPRLPATWRRPALRCATLVAAAVGSGAFAQALMTAPPPLDVTGRVTGFVASEAGSGAPRAGARLDVFAKLARPEIGDGLTVTAHAEAVVGRNVADANPDLLLPPNTALFLPGNNEPAADLSVSATQVWGPVALTFGKINMIDLAAETPLVGGGGVEGFQHLQFAAPQSFLMPPTVFGAIAQVDLGKATLFAGAWDSETAVQKAWPDDGFADLSGMVGISLPVQPGGLPGVQSLQVLGTTADKVTLSDLGYSGLPSGFDPQVGARDTGWMVKYSFQQYLWIDRSDPRRGWGVFGQANLWDGDPTLTDWGLSVGVTGTGPFAGRPEDRFGLGYFVLSPSEALTDSLASMALPFGVREERGAEAFYTWQAGERVRLTATGQVIEPGVKGSDIAWIGGLRLLVSF